jgi:hypothetical protein
VLCSGDCNRHPQIEPFGHDDAKGAPGNVAAAPADNLLDDSADEPIAPAHQVIEQNI